MEENAEIPGKEKKLKLIIWILSGIILVLAVLLILTRTQVHTIVVEKEKTANQNAALQHELDSLLKVHDSIKAEHKTLSGALAQKDSIIMANAQEIQRLIGQSADYKQIKKKLGLLRGFTQGYLTQIDSLYRVNQSLRDENIQIQNSFKKEQEKTNELSKDKEALAEKVNMASYLKAYNISAEGYKLKSGGKKESATERARRTDAVKICFTLSENPIIQPGTKTVYARIARPDNVIVTEGKEDIYTFEYQGQKLQYTIKQDVTYDGKAQNLCMSWVKKDKKAAAMKGTYNVALFLDGYELGKTTFDLK